MAENKKSVLIYVDWINIFEELSDEEAGKLIKHLFRYINDKNPEVPDRLTKLLFEPIKQTLKRDLVKYEDKRSKNRDNILKRWNKTDTAEYDRIKDDTKHTDSDNVSGSVKDSDNVKEEDKVSAKKAERDFIDKIVQIFVEVHGDYLIVNNGIERAAAGKLLKIYKKKYPDATSEETLAALKEYFLSCINIPDDWLRTNMSLPTIISKFNQISKILKNGTTKKSGATYADIARITVENFPEQFSKA